jgi:hypothetical protein
MQAIILHLIAQDGRQRDIWKSSLGSTGAGTRGVFKGGPATFINKGTNGQ